MTPPHTALRVDVADLLTHPAARRSVELSSSFPGLNGSAARVPEDEPVVLDLIFERVPDGIVVRGTISARWCAECSTCLRELERTAVLEVNELFEPEPLEGDTYPLVGHELDLEQLVRDSVLLDLPLAPTCEGAGVGPCRDDGALADRGRRSPSLRGRPENADDVPQADDDPTPDPRWRALSELEL